MTFGLSFIVMALALPQWRLLEQGWTLGAGLASLYFSLWQIFVISAPFMLLDQHEVESPRVRLYYGLAVLAAALYVATQ